MCKRTSKILQNQDVLAEEPHFSYQASGTAIGGCCSLLVSITIFIFLIQRLLALYRDPLFNQTESIDYYDAVMENNIDISIEETFPAFIVEDIYKEGESSGKWSLNHKYNDLSLWEPIFVQHDGDSETEIAAKSCTEVLQEYVPEKAERMIEELDLGDDYLCPDVASYKIGLQETVSLSFQLKIKEGQESVIQGENFLQSKVKFAQVSAYFNPKTWRTERIMKHIAFASETF